MSAAIRDHIKRMRVAAHRLALETCMKPKAEREYMNACGKVQQMMAEADSLEQQFLAPEMPDPEADLDQDTPRTDRVAAARARHRPRSM